MKISVARLFCFTTVFLLCCSFIGDFSSIKAENHLQSGVKIRSIFHDLRVQQTKKNDSNISLFTENDSNEDTEDFEIIGDVNSRFTFNYYADKVSFGRNYNPHSYLSLLPKISRWLWTRQIRI